MYKKYFFLSIVMMAISNGFLYSMNNLKGAPPGESIVARNAYKQACLNGGRNAALCTAILTIPTLFMHRDCKLEKIMIPTTSIGISCFCGVYFALRTARKWCHPVTIVRRGHIAGVITGTMIGTGVLGMLYLEKLHLDYNK